jgi:hypothetical protein
MTVISEFTSCRFLRLFNAKKGGKVVLRDFYRVYLGRRQGQHIWIVDGARVVRDLYPPFVMGGNDQRYRFNPVNDLWIDNRIGGIELEYTIAHELIERKLMRTRGMTYDRAHVAGLAREKEMRAKDARMIARHTQSFDPAVAAVYRAFYKEVGGGLDGGGKGDSLAGGGGRNGRGGQSGRDGRGGRAGLKIWFVDGPTVRKLLEPDFCFVGCDLEYGFIPRGEIWLDGTASCQHVYFALTQQLERRRLMASGLDEEAAYKGGVARQIEEYRVQEELAREHEDWLAEHAAVTYGDRDRGVKPGRRQTSRRT